MKTNVIRIGNSRGIRIPKRLLEECRLEETVELEAHKDHLVVRSATKPRGGWEEAFRRMAEARDDKLSDRHLLESTRWDKTEWQW
jgi:antitoxin MazE